MRRSARRRGRSARRAGNRRFSSSVRSRSSVVSWNTSPMLRRTSKPARAVSCPATAARPREGVSRVARRCTVVVLPAPFGPRKPKNSPSPTSRSKRSSARIGPKSFPNPLPAMPPPPILRRPGSPRARLRAHGTVGPPPAPHAGFGGALVISRQHPHDLELGAESGALALHHLPRLLELGLGGHQRVAVVQGPAVELRVGELDALGAERLGEPD